MPGKLQKPKDPNPRRPLPVASEELYCQFRVDGASQADAYRWSANRTMKDAAARKRAWMLSLKGYVKARIAHLVMKRDQDLYDRCKEFEVTRSAVIANAVLGWRMAREKGDLASMSRHNNDMANFAREAYWNNQAEITLEGPLERMLREVEADGPFKPGNGSAAGTDHNEPQDAS